MTFQALLFYTFATVLIGSGLAVITLKNAVHAALCLVLAFFTASALWILLFAEFLAVTLIVVYVGAVMVLFLFVVMMLDINFAQLREGFWRYLPVAAIVAVVMAVEMALLLTSKAFGLQGMASKVPAAGASNVKEIGRVLYTDYLLPFELASVVLLIAIIAAIALTLRGQKASKYQDMGEQVRVKASDRLKIVSLPSEGGEAVPGAQEAGKAGGAG